MQSETDSTFTYNVNTSGNIEIKVILSDGELTDSLNWTLESTVNIAEKLLPQETSLYQNYPNPFNPTTTIKYDVKEAGMVEVAVYNSRGALVKKLVNENKEAGRYQLKWSGIDSYGRGVTSGLYFYKMSTKGFTKIRRALLVK